MPALPATLHPVPKLQVSRSPQVRQSSALPEVWQGVSMQIHVKQAREDGMREGVEVRRVRKGFPVRARHENAQEVRVWEGFGLCAMRCELPVEVFAFSSHETV